MAKTQKLWGPALHTFSYHMLMSAEHSYDDLIDLRCYTLSDADYTLSDPIEVNCVEFRGGQLVPVTITLRGARVQKVDWTLTIPQGYTLWNEIQVLSESECRRDLILCYLCPQRTEYNHFVRIPDFTVGSLQRQGTFVEGADGGGTPLTAQTTLSATGQDLTYYYTDFVLAQTNGDAVHAVSWAEEECAGCTSVRFLDGYFGGAALNLEITTDRFVNGTDLSPTLPALSIVTDILVNGNNIVITYADTADPATAATGGIAVSADAGTTFTDLSTAGNAPVEAFFDVAFAGGTYVAVGSDGNIAQSNTLASFTAVTNTVAATADFYTIEYFEDQSVFLIGGVDAGAGVVLTYNSNIQVIIDITASVSTAAAQAITDIHSRDNWVAVAGVNFYTESDDFSIWSDRLLPASGDTYLAGDAYEVYAAIGTSIYRSDPCSSRQWKEVVARDGTTTIAGDYTDIQGIDTSLQRFWIVAGTDAGELVIASPRFPNA
jgi:hypothetical protein